LTLTSSENIQTPTISMSIGGTSISPTVSGSNTSWTATYTVINGNNGSVSFSI